MQGAPASPDPRVRKATSFDMEGYALGLTPCRRLLDRRAPEIIDYIDVRSGLGEHDDPLLRADPRSQVQRNLAEPATGIESGSRAEEGRKSRAGQPRTVCHAVGNEH